jgi:hypothetical protein
LILIATEQPRGGIDGNQNLQMRYPGRIPTIAAEEIAE